MSAVCEGVCEKVYSGVCKDCSEGVLGGVEAVCVVVMGCVEDRGRCYSCAVNRERGGDVRAV